MGPAGAATGSTATSPPFLNPNHPPGLQSRSILKLTATCCWLPTLPSNSASRRRMSDLSVAALVSFLSRLCARTMENGG